jgi:hypothetical protein
VIRITIAPAHDRAGARHPNRFTAVLDKTGDALCSTETPLLDAARALLKTGKAGKDDVIVMRHAGAAYHYAMRARVGVAASLMRAESAKGGRIRLIKASDLVMVWPRDCAEPPDAT